jgi:hydrogenase maturation protein HypF
MQHRLHISGVVQGVGFRPCVWHLAQDLGLTGWVRNTAGGVECLLQGEAGALAQFEPRLRAEAPPLADIHHIDRQHEAATETLADFNILESGTGKPTTIIGADSATCPDCLAELFNPQDRRYRYPFINCTHCGPRYTITRRLPYDRAQTSMAHFPLCPDCAREYHAPADRRFHAEPTACAVCGPRLWLESSDGDPIDGDPIAATLHRLQAGEIVAIKGLGGFHLVCDARNGAAVARLRQRKGRDAKPFALMAANLVSVAQWVKANSAEQSQLDARERPIVLLQKQPGADTTFPNIAPGLAWLGLMRPYTPIHWLLWHEAAARPQGTDWIDKPQDLVLVMTSANPGGEPLVIDNAEARSRLSGLADAWLMHDRDIVVRCDDSLLRLENNQAQFIRRARGYTPTSIRLAHSGPSVLALGGYFKNTVCVTRGHEAFLSQHIGGLDNPATCAMLREVAQHLLDILQVKPERIAHDRHPDFYSTRLAQELAAQWGVMAVPVQHHHAHIAAVMAEHHLSGPILGLALDGIGLGTDGQAWGGELLRVEGARFDRLGHLAARRLPGGDRAAREPWRMAASVLFDLADSDSIVQRFADQANASGVAQLLQKGVNCPPTTSLGRHFDAAAGLLGLCPVVSFEGQAAMQLEGLAETASDAKPWPDSYRIGADGVLDLKPLFARLLDHAHEPALAAARFHASLAVALADWTQTLAKSHNLQRVALGGGCFLNRILTHRLRQSLHERGLTVYEARQAPPNDGGLSLGQAWIAQQEF